MYLSKKRREEIRNKFGGKCAYTGTQLDDDWQIDHCKPLVRKTFSNRALFAENHTDENLYPCQKIINHYKGSLDLETFRQWYLMGLHERLKKLPKNPTASKSMKRKQYLLKVANLFGISEDRPFSGKFYFETFNDKL